MSFKVLGRRLFHGSSKQWGIFTYRSYFCSITMSFCSCVHVFESFLTWMKEALLGSTFRLSCLSVHLIESLACKSTVHWAILRSMHNQLWIVRQAVLSDLYETRSGVRLTVPLLRNCTHPAICCGWVSKFLYVCNFWNMQRSWNRLYWK